MVERYLNLFSVGFLVVVLAVFALLYSGAPIVCGLGGVHANVPWAGSATLLAGSERDLDIYLTRDRQVVVGRMFVPQRDLRRQLAAIADRTGSRPVLVHADGSVPFALVQDVLAASRDAGYTEVSLVTFRGMRIEAWEKGGAV